MSIPLDVPVGWSNPASVNLFHAILLLGGIPLLLFIVITAAVYLPAVVRGERVTPGVSPMQDQWLGGPAGGPAELTAGPGSASSAGAVADAETGGASGRW